LGALQVNGSRAGVKDEPRSDAELRITHSPEETLALGRALAARLHAPVLLLLKGELGAGKTTLAKGIIHALGVAREEEITSPTFTLVHVFGARRAGAKAGAAALPTVYHVDLYRIERASELESLALEDVLGSTEPAIVIVEWSERLNLRTTWPVVRIEMSHQGGDRRAIWVTGLEQAHTSPKLY
jgi:tRNA threonylcarbamoyladenosine biosynthesis protein TsaE